MIKRKIEDLIARRLKDDKIIAIFGPRQVGKTTVLEEMFIDSKDIFWLSGDEQYTLNLFKNFDKNYIIKELEGANLLIIDEAQNIEDIGVKLKILYDNFKGKIKIITTGSSAFDLANKINEPLTGRKWELRMFPIMFSEMVENTSVEQEKLELSRRLRYGYYPEIINNKGLEEEILKDMVNANLYKDILKWSNLQKSDKLIALLQALAYQIGNQVSINEIANLIDLDSKTVQKYITLLEQSFIIYHFGSYSRNLRNELKSSKKFYFYDVGIRNSLINNFSSPDTRPDIGQLFENFMISELIKKNNNIKFGNAGHFWRTTTQQEVDYVYEKDGKITAYEFKWNPKRKAKIPKMFIEAYLPHESNIINRDNFSEVLL